VAVRRTVSAHEQIRRRAGLTITALAERSGYSRPYVSLVEGGLQKPSARYRATIAKALDVPEELIFGQSANETAPGEKEASPQARRRHQPELTPTSQRSASEH